MKRFILPALAGTAILALAACGGETTDATADDSQMAQDPAMAQDPMATPPAGDDTMMEGTPPATDTTTPMPDEDATPAAEKTDGSM